MMKIGDVFLYTDNEVKIIMFDDKEVFFFYVNDKYFDFVKQKTVSYYRTTREHFDNNSTYLCSSELNKNIISIHRPDLPLKLNCFINIFWSHTQIGSLNDFKSFLNSKGISENELVSLDTNKVAIFPQGQQLSEKKPTVLETSHSKFSGLELMYQCFQIQREHVNNKKPYFSRFRLIQVGREEKRITGIGLYRLGIKGNIPSYYLGGHLSSMDVESDSSLIV